MSLISLNSNGGTLQGRAGYVVRKSLFVCFTDGFGPISVSSRCPDVICFKPLEAMSSCVKNAVPDGNHANFDFIQIRIESLSSKMDKLINIQEKVLNRLDGMSQDIDGIEKDMENLKVDKEEIHLPPRMVNQTQVMSREVREICQEMSTIMSAVNQRSEQQSQKLEGMENLVLSMQQVVNFIGEMVKSSRVMKLMFKNPAARKLSKPKDAKAKKAPKKKSSTDTINKKPEKVGVNENVLDK